MRSTPPGFTLIELLVVIGIIAILASIVIVAINPMRMLAQARNTQRRSDTEAILSALTQYSIDNNGALPEGIPDTDAKQICRRNALSCINGVDLDILTVNAIYLTSIPTDPQTPIVGTGAGYWIVTAPSSRVTVSAPGAELDESIELTR